MSGQPQPEFRIRKTARKGPTVQSREFGSLALQLKIFGSLALLIGLPVCCASIYAGIIALLPGAALLAVGFGLEAYKPWAWYGAVLTLIPISLLVAIGTLWLTLTSRNPLSLSLLAGPLYVAYVLWALLSPSGRRRYWETIAAIENARANPDSVAGKFVRRR